MKTLRPKLRAYLIGDSIAGTYSVGVQQALAGEIDIDLRPENGEDSRRVLARAVDWLGDRQYDLIHLNCGLHDIKWSHQSGATQVPLEEYESNLRQIVTLLRGHASVLVWARTTPVIDGQPVATKAFDRFNRDVDAYNHVADQVMADCEVAINDLHGAILETGTDDCISEDGVHMTDKGYAVLSSNVAAAVRAALADDGQANEQRGDS
jgi:lysophospholipase L1-like esterase